MQKYFKLYSVLHKQNICIGILSTPMMEAWLKMIMHGNNHIDILNLVMLIMTDSQKKRQVGDNVTFTL